MAENSQPFTEPRTGDELILEHDPEKWKPVPLP
jgi:hypothetical protein